MCVIGIKYQFITLHDNTNIPCRLKKKGGGGGGGVNVTKQYSN